MSPQNKRFCFCTLALGQKYSKLAALLAQDIEKFSPGTTLIILTDKPEEFSHYPQVLVVEHKIQGVKCYHDKRFAIAKSLSLFDACIFLDSDMRILAEVPEEINWLLVSGITARACKSMPEKFAKAVTGNANKEFTQQYNLVRKATEMLNLTTEWSNIQFVHEYLFSVTKDDGKEMEFLRQWENLANYFEANGFYDAEGNAIGLAAAKAGMSVRWGEMPGIDFFNNKTELIRIAKGQSKMEEMSKYFEEQNNILYSQRSLINKIIERLNQRIQFFYRKIRRHVFNLPLS